MALSAFPLCGEMRDFQVQRVTAFADSSFQIIHQGYPDETLVRFLVAREWNIQAAHEMVNPNSDFLPPNLALILFFYADIMIIPSCSSA